MVTIFTISVAFLSGVCVGLIPAFLLEEDEELLDNRINFD